MRWILRGLGILLLTALILVGAAWAVLVFTDLPARLATAGFNEENPELWLEARSARLHGDLLGVTVEGVALAERTKKAPIVHLDRFDAALGALPSDALVSVDHADLEGLHVEIDATNLPALQELVRSQAATTEPSKPSPLVRLGRLRLQDASFVWRGPADSVELKDLDLELKGVVGATIDLTLTLALAAVEARGWTTDGVRLDELALSWQGLGGKLRLDGLSVGHLAGPGFELTDATLGLAAEGGVTGLQLTRATLTSASLSAALDGHAKPTFGLTGQGLEVVLQGTLEAAPAALLPGTCPGVTHASGRFRVVGDPTKGGLALESLALSLTTPAGVREVTRTGVSLADRASLGALLARVCAEAGVGAP